MSGLPPLDHYRLLGVRSDAPPDEIAAAYRLRAQVCHPDRLSSSSPAVVAAAGQLMSLLNEARDTLSDPTKRAVYDLDLRRTPSGPPASPPAAAKTPPPPVPLRVVPEVVEVADVTPGEPVVAIFAFESSVAQDSGPSVAPAPGAGPAVGVEVIARSSRRARVRVRLDTSLLAEHRRYAIDLPARWGTASGTVRFVVHTTELQVWTEPEAARGRHPSSRARRISGRERWRRVSHWATGGLVVPILLVALARGRLGFRPGQASGWLLTAGVALTAMGLYPLVVSRGFSRPLVMRRGPGTAGSAVMWLGRSVLWALGRSADAALRAGAEISRRQRDAARTSDWAGSRTRPMAARQRLHARTRRQRLRRSAGRRVGSRI